MIKIEAPDLILSIKGIFIPLTDRGKPVPEGNQIRSIDLMLPFMSEVLIIHVVFSFLYLASPRKRAVGMLLSAVYMYGQNISSICAF